MIKTVLKEYPKVTKEEDYSSDRIMNWLIRYYNDEKQGYNRAKIAFNKLDAILVARGAEIITVELLKVLIKQAIALADLQYTDDEIEQGHADTRGYDESN